jgi:hypothetical protein
MATLNLRIDETLRNKFKALCAERGTSMTSEISWLMTRELEKATKKAQKNFARMAAPGVSDGDYKTS